MEDKLKAVHMLGYASSIGGKDKKAGDGPLVLRQSSYFSALAEKGLKLHWDSFLQPAEHETSQIKIISMLNQNLALSTQDHVKKQEFFVVLGGDHSCAVGTWSGAHQAIQGPLGLIWIDAHMDSHTPETSHTGNIHGMPLAALLGQGDPALTQLLNPSPKLIPSNLCLIGVRSYEPEEANLLKRLNVRIFFMDEIKQRGMKTVLAEAIKIVTKNTANFGVSLDLDAIDPIDAPGTTVKEPDGIPAKELLAALPLLSKEKGFIGAEIVEFNSSLDQDAKTEKLVPELLAAMCNSR